MLFKGDGNAVFFPFFRYNKHVQLYAGGAEAAQRDLIAGIQIKRGKGKFLTVRKNDFFAV